VFGLGSVLALTTRNALRMGRGSAACQLVSLAAV
jgi:hypothetical protein